MKPVFVTGIGTDVGKTLVSAIIVKALQADYWKPVQAGYEQGTDSMFISSMLGQTASIVHPETYKFAMAASPHLAARAEGIEIDLQKIAGNLPRSSGKLLIEGAGGLMVPLNNHQFVADLAALLEAKLLIVSRNYLGSINHSLLTAAVCKQRGLDVAGWVFTGDYGNYEKEIAEWSGYPVIAKIPTITEVNVQSISEQAAALKESFTRIFMQ